MIRHVVLLRFADGVSVSDKQALYDALAALREYIAGIVDFRAGPNVSVEGPLTQGFDDGFWFDFESAAVRDAYLVHPEHQAIGARIVEAAKGGLDGVLVFDFEL